MTLMKRKPFNGLSKFFEEDFPGFGWKPFRDVDKFFEEGFTQMTLPKLGWDLAVDVYEKDGNIIAEMNLPGIEPDKIDVTVEDNYLKIKGEREEKKETEEKDYYSKEIKRGSFERAIALPAYVKKDSAEATYKDGVLKIAIPKDIKKEGSIKVKVSK